MKKVFKIIIPSFVILLLLVLAFATLYFQKEIQSSNSNSNQYKIVEIKKDDGAKLIASNLRNKGIIKSDFFFLIALKISKKTLNYGYYQIPLNASIVQVINMIADNQTIVYKVTIPEGWRAEQIAQILSERKIVGYNDFLAKAKDLEGTLFPDTYFFSPNSTAADVVAKMTNDYKERVKGQTISDEDLIIASIVEREAVKDEERPIIAGIYKNRIQRKMKLEADPTVQYGKDNRETSLSELTDLLAYKYWRPITLADYYNIDSDFNTYRISGLPPAPICNPGVKSIEATLNYTKHDFVYFLQANGNIYPAKTLAEHNQNRVKYLGAKL